MEKLHVLNVEKGHCLLIFNEKCQKGPVVFQYCILSEEVFSLVSNDVLIGPCTEVVVVYLPYVAVLASQLLTGDISDCKVVICFIFFPSFAIASVKPPCL